jgi:tetratricopeptide (TPR) repeat protein
MPQLEKTVFICYQRENTAHALRVFDQLHSEYDVFLQHIQSDMRLLDQRTIEQISGRAHFIVILTPSAVRRTITNPADPYAQSIQTAIVFERHIIPLLINTNMREPIEALLPESLSILKTLPHYAMNTPYWQNIIRNEALDTPVTVTLHPQTDDESAWVAQQYAKARASLPVADSALIDELSLEEAIAHTHACQFRQALPIIQKVRNTHPNPDLTYFWQAQTYHMTNRPRLAVDYFARAIALNPHLIEAYVGRGMAHLASQRYQLALTQFENALALNPQSVGGLFGRANAYIMKGNYERRIHSYAGVIDERYGIAEYEQAFADLTTVITQVPEAIPAYLERGFIYREMRDYQHAIADYTTALNMTENNDMLRSSVLYMRGITHFKDENYTRAIADFEESLALNPKNRRAKGGLKQATHQQKRREKFGGDTHFIP